MQHICDNCLQPVPVNRLALHCSLRFPKWRRGASSMGPGEAEPSHWTKVVLSKQIGHLLNI